MSRPTTKTATRGRGRGRGGGGAPRSGAQAATLLPLAAQLRQLDRETGPEEPRLLRRYEPLGFIRIRSEYGVEGLVRRDLGRLSASGEALEWVPLHEAELLLAQHQRAEETARLVARIATRLAEPRPRDLESCTPEQMRILRMSNTAYARFRSGAGDTASEGSQDPREA